MYDRLIIGNDLSSLIAALASSRSGLKTVLITEEETNLEYREAGYAFPIDTTPLSGFGEKQTVFHLFKEMHLSPDHVPPFVPIRNAFQVILPTHRVDLFSDRAQMVAEIIREFPLLEQNISRFYHAVSEAGALIGRWIEEDGAGESNTLRKLIRGMVRLPSALLHRASIVIPENSNGGAFRRIIEAQLAAFSHLDIRDITFPLTAAYLLSLPSRGVFYSLGGRNALLNWLRNQFKEAGGILMKGYSVIRIDTKTGITVDLESPGSSTTSLCGKKLIVSIQWEKLNLLLLNQKVFKRLKRRLNSIPRAYPFCMHLGVNEEGLPERMAPAAIIVRNERQSATGRNLVFIETSLPGETERAPNGKRAVNATVFLKASPLVLDDAELKGIAADIIDSLESFLPFLRESIDFVNVEKSIALARQYQETINHKYVVKKRLLIGMTILSPKTPLPNIFLTGGLLRAGLGFEGEILAGMDAVFWAGREVHNNG